MSFNVNGNAIRVTPRDSLGLDEIAENVRVNLDLITEWVDFKDPAPSEDVVWLIGGGPSLDDAVNTGFFNASLFERNPSHRLWLCKHALPMVSRGFENVELNVIALDPRPIDGTSTHGIKRLSLYNAAPSHTVFYLASMTSPSVTKHLLEKGYRVVAWHASSDCLKAFVTETREIIEKNFHRTVVTGAFSIGGGTSSLLRGIGLCKSAFGVSRFRLLGLDSSLRLTSEEVEWSKDPNSPWRLEKDSITGSIRRMPVSFGVGNDDLWSTGELIAQGQDLDAMLTQQDKLGVEIKIVGTDKGRSLAGQIWDRFQA